MFPSLSQVSRVVEALKVLTPFATSRLDSRRVGRYLSVELLPLTGAKEASSLRLAVVYRMD
jgi:hypothetical protein